MPALETVLTDVRLFEGLDTDALAAVAGCAAAADFAVGDVLFREGRPADRFFVVRHGRVAIEVHRPGGGHRVVDTAEDGDVVGWSWLVPPYRWLFDAIAVEPTQAVGFDAVRLRAACDADPRLGYLLMQRLTHALHERLQAVRVRGLDLYGRPQ